MHYVKVKGILSAKNGMNLYRGCQHGCIYCDSRSKCYQMHHDFEDIEVKENAIELLEQGVGSRIVGVKENRIYDIDIDEALSMKKDINELFYKVAREISI